MNSRVLICIMFIAHYGKCQDSCSSVDKDEICGFTGISEYICHIRGCCYDGTQTECFYPNGYFKLPGKRKSAFLGTSVLNAPSPSTAMADSLIRKKLETELKKAFRFRLPQIASVKVKNFTDVTFDFVVSVSSNAADTISTDLLWKSYADALQQRDPTITNDLNECSFGRVCGFLSVCVNTMGSYYCDCERGYSKNITGLCNDIDECLSSSACRRDQDCFNTFGSYECRCKSGYKPSPDGTSCADVNECIDKSTNDCDADREICVNRAGSYDCRCKNSFSVFGKTYCVVDNPCNANPCHVNSICLIDGSSYICKCAPGYVEEGDSSCNAIDFCSSTPSNNCHPNANCLSAPGTYICSCLDGYLGDGRSFCDDIDECLVQNLGICGTNGMCVNTDGSYRCQCENGFVRDTSGVCDDVDECKSLVPMHNCHVNAVCYNTPGSFQCECAAGYEGDGVRLCEIIDPTKQGLFCDPFYGPMKLRTSQSLTCAFEAVCKLGPSSFYSCKCPIGLQGYEGLYCDDIDECAEGVHACHARATCNNTLASYTCTCDVGYLGDGRKCIDMDECAEGMDDCSDSEVCKNTRGSYICDCPNGFVRINRVCQELLLFRAYVPLNTSYTYSDRLQDKKSDEFTNLAQLLQVYLLGQYGPGKGGKVLDVAIMSFLKGSVVAEHVIAAIDTDVRELYLAFQAQNKLQANPMVARTPTRISPMLSDYKNLRLPAGSATGRLFVNSRGRIRKVFTGIVHLRPAVIARFETIYGNSLMTAHFMARHNFIGKLTRDLTLLHDSKYLQNVRITKIELSRSKLDNMATKVRDQRTKFYKASTTLSNRMGAFNKTSGLFHKMMRYIVPDYTRRYEHAFMEKQNMPAFDGYAETNASFSFLSPVIVSLLDTRTSDNKITKPKDFTSGHDVIVDHLVTVFEGDTSTKIDANLLSQSFLSSGATKPAIVELAPEAGRIYYFVSLFQEWNITSFKVVGDDILLATYQVETEEGADDMINIQEMDLYNWYEGGMANTPISEADKLAVVGIPKKILMTRFETNLPENIIDKDAINENTAASKEDRENQSLSLTASSLLMAVIDPIPIVNLPSQSQEFQRVAAIFDAELLKAFLFGLQSLSATNYSWNVTSVNVKISNFREPLKPEVAGGGRVVAEFQIDLKFYGDRLSPKDLETLLRQAYEISKANGYFTASMFIGSPWNFKLSRSEIGSGVGEFITNDETTVALTSLFSTTATVPALSEMSTTRSLMPLDIGRTTTNPVFTTSLPRTVDAGLSDALALLLQSPGLSLSDVQHRVSNLTPRGRALLMILLENSETKMFMPQYALRYLQAALQLF